MSRNDQLFKLAQMQMIGGVAGIGQSSLGYQQQAAQANQFATETLQALGNQFGDFDKASVAAAIRQLPTESPAALVNAAVRAIMTSPVKRAAKAEDEFVWLRRRVAEVCWRAA